LIGAVVMASMLPLWGAPLDVSIFPQPEDVRFQVISKQAGEKEWPFAVTTGTLACVPGFGFRVVMFFPYSVTLQGDEALDELQSREEPVIVTVDPLQLLFSDASYFVPDMTIEDKIRRMGPFVSFGKKLCDQPKGTVVGPGEL
jgi:hypothetical protein